MESIAPVVNYGALESAETSSCSSSSSSQNGRKTNATTNASHDEEETWSLQQRSFPTSSVRVGRSMVLVLMAMIFSMVVYTYRDSFAKSVYGGIIMTSFLVTMEDPLSAEATNEYSYRNLKRFPYPFLEGALLLEPYREGTITITPKKEGCVCSYAIVPASGDTTLTMSGSDDGEYVFFVTPTKTGKYTMSVEESCDGIVGRSLEQTVWVKYVKREMQSLNDYDREEFLDVYHKMVITFLVPTVLYMTCFRSLLSLNHSSSLSFIHHHPMPCILFLLHRFFFYHPLFHHHAPNQKCFCFIHCKP